LGFCFNNDLIRINAESTKDKNLLYFKAGITYYFKVTAFNNKFNTEQLQNYLTNITKLGLIPDSDVTGLTGRFYDINGTQMNSLFSNKTLF
jgi:hypothetical protein